MSESTPIQSIESAPNARGRISAYIGRVGTGIAAQSYDQAVFGGMDINNILDSYESSEVGLKGLEPESIEGRRLVAAMNDCKPLERPTFISTKIFGRGASVASIAATTASPVRLPTRNFVSAPEMIDWDHGRDTSFSMRKIRAYARMRSQAPPIERVGAYVQPDGRTLFSVNQDGAHRVAAAHLRGDKTIRVGSSVAVYRLDQNILPINTAPTV
jgi:hypothetical protein